MHKILRKFLLGRILLQAEDGKEANFIKQYELKYWDLELSQDRLRWRYSPKYSPRDSCLFCGTFGRSLPRTHHSEDQLKFYLEAYRYYLDLHHWSLQPVSEGLEWLILLYKRNCSQITWLTLPPLNSRRVTGWVADEPERSPSFWQKYQVIWPWSTKKRVCWNLGKGGRRKIRFEQPWGKCSLTGSKADQLFNMTSF